MVTTKQIKTIDYSGSKFTGEVNENGKPDGQGTEWWPDGDHYEGQFKSAKYGGHGVYYYALGKEQIKCDGEFRNGERNEHGIEYYSNGDRYDGNWVNGCRESRGTHTFRSGEWYEGEFHRDKYNGHGTYYYPSGNRYDCKYCMSQ
ncbi:unnamed protein product [Didymodactylos carnosus]|uniref:Uncharacterized protein n=1 Tax=Didymodactylos carnosus TaxID=1234261 RepID=A0A815LX39_9BILA|nr:unnamed protein product [Didymodactylos carnosus]CAF1412492.1 unnamed protein product [Didymodactylos carnosus]CAF3865360.1 unnamed protein product [Didymodactylos carnosus]CAF4300330.1 unnamed protein product [Didymodactylos carnosus]